MLRIAAGLAVMMAGCVEDRLSACGDLACPVGTVCVEGDTCARADQVDACVGIADGLPCHTANGDGRCRHSACLASQCGDGIVEAGEVCDDGNVISGDGCRGDCLSDETCGNGLVDVGETCDCGRDATVQPAGCPTANSEAVSAVCDPQCSRRCGDGAITGTEQCDGDLRALACTDVGYYAGTPGCTPFCTLDFSTCSGRCGDGVVQVVDGELCDGAPPSGSCIDYGRDYGALGCSSFCAPDLANTCGRFGWQQISTLAGTVLGANAHGLVVVGTDLEAEWDGVATSRPNPGWNLGASSTGAIVVAGAASFGKFDGTWHDVAANLGAPIAIAVLGDVGYALAADCALVAIELGTGAAIAVPRPPATSCSGVLGADDGKLYVAAGADGLLRLDPTGWVVAHPAGTDRIAPAATGHLALWNTGVGTVDDFVIASGARSGTRFDASGPLAVDRDGVAATVFSNDDAPPIVFTRVYAGAFDAPIPPPTATDILRSADGSILAFGAGVFRLGPADLVIGLDATQLAVASDDTLEYCGTSTGWIASDGTASANPTPDGACAAFVGDVRGEHYIANGTAIYHFDPIANAYTQELLGSFGSLAGTPDDLWTTVDNQPNERIAGVWTPHPTPATCDTASGFPGYLVAGGNGTPIYAASLCDNASAVFRWDAGAWTLLVETTRIDFFQPELVDHLDVLADGTVFVSAENYYQGSVVYRLDGATLTPVVTTAPRVTGVPGQAAGPSGTDVFVTAGDGRVAHFDGTTAAPIDVPAGAVAASPRSFYDVIPTTRTLHVITRQPGRVRGL